MRVSLPTMILSLATTLTWLGWLAVSAEAQAPGVCQTAENCAATDQGQCQGQCPGPLGICDVPCDPGQCGPRWTFAGEAIALQRTNTRSQRLFTNVQTTNTYLLDANDLNFPVAFGMQVGAIRHDVCGCGCDLEVAYFQVDGFTAQGAVPGLSRLVTDVNGTGFSVTNGNARYTSALYSGELNARRQCTDWLTLLAGFRMGQLNEHYRGEGTDVSTLQPDWLATNTCNHLYGFQLGADAEVYNMGGPLQINALCKAGIYDNVANQSYRRVQTGLVDESFAASRDQASFLGEAGLVATYALTKRLAFRASAEAIWLTGVALAPEQISSVNLRTSSATLNTSGTVFYYGGGLGFEYRF
jgi:hypothetical protein